MLDLKSPAAGGRHMMDRTKSGPRLLIAEEKQALRCDMANLHLGQSRTKTSTSSKEQKNYAHGIYDVIESDLFLTAYYLSVFSYH